MSKQKIRTTPDLSLDSPAHQDALVNDKEFRSWQFNVADRFKSHTVEEIKQELQRTAHPFAVCMENWRGEFNFSTLVRNANVFNAKEVFYMGDKKWDKRGAQGVYNYTEVKWLPTIDDFIKLKERYAIIAVDNIDGAIPISSYSPVPNTLFVFGSEGTGLTPAIQKMCDQLIYIEQFGSVRSLNCGVASGIVMNDFVQKIRKFSFPS